MADASPMAPRWGRYPRVAENSRAREWFTVQADLQLAANTIDAYGRAVDEFLDFAAVGSFGPLVATRADIGRFVRYLVSRCARRTGEPLANATIQQRITAVRCWKAGYFERNVRTIDVLVNREKLRGQTGTAAHGLYYDLVHGWCTNEFFAQCPHRLACARCPFYLPKDSEEVHVLAAEGNLIRLRQDLLLTDEERLVIDGDVAAYRALRQRMWDVATPAGPKPSELDGVVT